MSRFLNSISSCACLGGNIHKCQGLALEEIVVDKTPSKGQFAPGQAYVLLDESYNVKYYNTMSSLYMVFIGLSKCCNSPTAVSFTFHQGGYLLPNYRLKYIEFGGK